MPHTKSRYMQDLGFTDGRVFAAANDVSFATTAGSLTLTRVAAGDWSLRAANTTTGFIALNVTNQLLRRLGFFEDLQEQFGSASGTFGPAGIPASAEYQGRPDTLASMATGQPITPRTAFKVKGFKLTSFDVIYTVSTANMTALTCRVDQNQYLEDIAVATTVVLASGVNGLDLTFDANPVVQNVAIPAPVYSNLADQALWIEIGLQTPGTGTMDFRGIDCYFEYNFN